MLSLFVAMVTICGFVGLSQAAPKEDLVTHLPGLPSQPPFKQYSGYLQGKGTKRLHYWFIESSGNPRDDPVVLWLTGGPGCSSMLGLLLENGPYSFTVDGGVTLDYDSNSWNQLGNMLYLESPAGVGYSYSADKDYTTDDNDTAINNLLALKDFFTKFPEFRKNDFYVTGESYAGIYVPSLVSDIIDDGSFNLKGFAVGNGLSDNDMNDNSLAFFEYYHGLLGLSQWEAMVSDCCPNNVSDGCNFAKAARNSQACAKHTSMVQDLAWKEGLNPYDLYVDCSSDSSLYLTPPHRRPFSSVSRSDDEIQKPKTQRRQRLQDSDLCPRTASATYYMNRIDVREALHIPEEVQKWVMCTHLNYSQIYDTVAPFYLKAFAHKLKVLVYNGDVDMACNFLGDEWFVESLKPTNPRERKMWYYENVARIKTIGGFVKVFDQVTLVTVRGAGHQVPTFKPRAALQMITNFIKDRPF